MSDEFPAPDQNGIVHCTCINCASNRREGLAVKARVRLARQAVADREPWGVLANHIVELVAMLEARGLA